MKIWFVAWTGVGLVAAVCLFVAIWSVRSHHSSKVDAANRRLFSAISDANKWMIGESLDGGQVVEMALVQAMADERVSDLQNGQSVLQAFRQHRKNLEERKRIAVAQEEASRIFDAAIRLIKLGQGRDAAITLKEYLAHEQAKNKTEAQIIYQELSIANSDSTVLNSLVAMDHEDFAEAETSGNILDRRVTRPEVIAILEETVKRNLPTARKKREAIEAEKKRLAEVRAMEELLRRKAEEKRLEDELERRRQIEEGLAARANEPSDLERFLYAGDFTNGIVDFQTQLLAIPQDDNIRFQLALTRFFGSLDRLGQTLHRFGLKPTVDQVPFLRLPVPANPNPAPISYADFRQIFEDLIRDLDSVDATLAGIKSEVAVSIRLGVIRFDMDGDGNADQELNAILKKLHSQEFAFLQGNEALPVDFDRGDAVWLRVYCQLMSAVLDFALAFDLEPGFDEGANLIFQNPKLGNRSWAGEQVLRISEPRRLARVRRRLILITELNHEMWKHVRAENDRNLEWLPNSKQQSVLGFTVNDQLVNSWLGAMTEVEAALMGDRVIPRAFFERNGKGFNLKNLLEDPPTVIDQLLIDGLPDSLPDKYFTDGIDFNVVTLYTLFQNYQSWFGNDQNF